MSGMSKSELKIRLHSINREVPLMGISGHPNFDYEFKSTDFSSIIHIHIHIPVRCLLGRRKQMYANKTINGQILW